MRIMHISPFASHPEVDVFTSDRSRDIERVNVVLKSSGSAGPAPYTITKASVITIEGVKQVFDQEYDQKLRRVFDKLLKEYRPDIVHIHAFDGMSLLPILNTASSLRIKKVITLHGSQLMSSSKEVIKRIKHIIDQTNLIMCVARPQQLFLKKIFGQNEKIISGKEAASDMKNVYRQVVEKTGRNLFFKVGHLCNSACLYCVAGDAVEPFIDIDILRKELEKKAADYECIIFTGGEPTMHPKFFELLAIVYYLGYKIEIQSNIRLFSSKRFTAKARKFNIKIIVCINSSHEDVFDIMADATGAFKQTVMGLNNLINARIEVDTKIIITTYNYDHLKDIVKFIHGFGIQASMIVFPTPIGLAMRNFKQITPQYKDIMSFVHEALKWGISHDMRMKTENIPGCQLDERYHIYNSEYTQQCNLDGIYLNVDKGLYNCKTERMDEQKQWVSGCSECRLQPKCEGVYREYVKHFGDEEFKPRRERVFSLKGLFSNSR